MVTKKFADNINESSNTLGTTTYQLEGANVGYRAFADAYVSTDTPYYAVRNQQDTKYELNRGGVFTNATPDTLTRSVLYSSSANAAISWQADDLPLTIYVPTSGEVLEAFITGWFSASRNALLSIGQWLKKDGISAGIHQLNFYDGASDIPIGQVDSTNHYYNAYRTGKKTRVTFTGMQHITLTATPLDNTIPQTTEMTLLSAADLAVTVESTTSKIRIKCNFQGSADSTAASVFIGVFLDSATGAAAVSSVYQATNQAAMPFIMDVELPNPGIGSHTYHFRMGNPSGGVAFTINGYGNAASFGTVWQSWSECEELF